MTKVFLAQLKCPNDHCVCAVALEMDDDDQNGQMALGVVLGESFQHMVDSGAMDPYCGLCKSADLRIEVQPTKYRTMAEAKGPLQEAQAQQLATREFFRRSRN